jgi:hypothetical protein
MEIRNLAERIAFEAQPEWFEYPGTNLALEMAELTPEEWDAIQRKSTTRQWDKKSRQHLEKMSNRKSTEMAYHTAISGCRGLTPRIVKEVFKLTWPWDDPEDEEITFPNSEIMAGFLFNLGRKSARLNRFVIERILPDTEQSQDEEDAYDEEKKILKTGS